MGTKTVQLATLFVGLTMAMLGGALKAVAVAKQPEIFSYVFFAGPDYLMFIGGLLLVVLAVGFDRLFGPEGPEA